MKTWDWSQSAPDEPKELTEAERLERKAADDKCGELIRENQARVLAGLGSPKVLVGGINLRDGPSFQTFPMIEMGASLVSITVNPDHLLRPDRLYCSPGESLVDALKRLPPKWKPDFFWDSQAEQGHYFPKGLGDVSFPTIVSFNHAHLGQALLHMQGMFDCIIAPSKFMSAWGDCVLPWGASWGTMGDRIRMFGQSYKGQEKDITISCTIGTSGAGKESIRHAVMAEMKAIKERRPDWNVFIRQGLAQDEYFDVLARSKVSVNVGTWGTSMTYRPLEIIEQEAILVHADENGYGSRVNLVHEPFLSTWYSFMYEPKTLQGDIEKALSMQSHGCAKEIKAAVNERYSYKAQYERLFNVAGSTKVKRRHNTEDWSRRAAAINVLTGYQEQSKPHQWALTSADRASALVYEDKDWDVCFWQPKDKEQKYIWQTDLSREFGNHREVYRRHAK